MAERLTDEDLDGIARFGVAIESDQQAMAAELLELRQRREQVEAELALALGAISAQDERETQAGARCDVPREQYGCDWPDAMADALLEARSEMRLARAERDELRRAARALMEAEDRYQRAVFADLRDDHEVSEAHHEADQRLDALRALVRGE